MVVVVDGTLCRWWLQVDVLHGAGRRESTSVGAEQRQQSLDLRVVHRVREFRQGERMSWSHLANRLHNKVSFSENVSSLPQAFLKLTFNSTRAT